MKPRTVIVTVELVSDQPTAEMKEDVKSALIEYYENFREEFEFSVVQVSAQVAQPPKRR